MSERRRGGSGAAWSTAPGQAYHEGRAVYRFTATRALKLCPAGHLLHAMHRRDWAGSWMAVEAANPPLVRCTVPLAEEWCR